MDGYLKVGQQYSDWIKLAIGKYDFEENEDFTIHKFVNGKATQKDYIVTIDMAKELCIIDGEPWFVAKDVCDALGISNNRDAMSRLDEDEKGVVLTDTLGGVQKLTVISESGLS